MLIGYARISKQDGTQVLDLQRDALALAGVAPHHIYCEMESGRKEERPELDHCLKALRAGDILVVYKLDRLCRNLRHFLNLMHQFEQEAIGFRVLSGAAADLDTTTSTGKLLFRLLAMVAEFETELIRERTLAGLAAAKKRGRTGGRPFALKGHAKAVALAATDMPVKALAAQLQVHPATIYRVRKQAKAETDPH